MCNILFGVTDNCLVRCCIEHGMPKECIKEETASKNVVRLNSTHDSITMVHGDKCFKFKTTLQDCKSECINPPEIMARSAREPPKGKGIRSYY